MKLNSVDRMSQLEKRDINRGSRYEPKNNRPRVVLIRFVVNPQVYQAPESSYFIAARAIGAYEALFNIQIYLLQNFFAITHVKW